MTSTGDTERTTPLTLIYYFLFMRHVFQLQESTNNTRHQARFLNLHKLHP